MNRVDARPSTLTISDTRHDVVLILGNGESRRKIPVLPANILSIGINEIITESLTPDIVVIDRPEILRDFFAHRRPVTEPNIAVHTELFRFNQGVYEYETDVRPSWPRAVMRRDHALHAAVGIAAGLGAKTVVFAGVDPNPDSMYDGQRTTARMSQAAREESRRLLEFDITTARIHLRTLYNHGGWEYPLYRTSP